MAVYRVLSVCKHWGQVSLGPQSRSSVLQNVRMSFGGGADVRMGSATLDVQTSAASVSFISITKSSGHAIWVHPGSSPDAFSIVSSNFTYNAQGGIVLTDQACQFSCTIDSVITDHNGFSGIYIDALWDPNNRGSVPLIRACNVSNSGMAFPTLVGSYSSGDRNNAGIRVYGGRNQNIYFSLRCW